eukprot:g9985.t1
MLGKSEDSREITSVDVGKSIENLMDKCTSFPNLGFLFGQASKFHPEVGQKIALSMPPDAVLIGGCVGALASVNTDCAEEDTVVETDTTRTRLAQHSLSLACMPETYRKAFHINVDKLEDTAAAVGCLPEPRDDNKGISWEWKVVVLLVDHSAAVAGLEDFIGAIQKKFPQVEVVGGIMGGNGDGAMIIVQDQNATSYNNGIVGLAIGGKTVFSSQVSRACKPICDAFKIVESEGPCIKSVVTTSGSEVVLQGHTMAAQAMQNMGRQRMATFFGITDNLDKGYTLHNSKFHAARDDLRLRLEAAETKCKAQSKTSLGGLLFTCGGRGYRLVTSVNTL